jgi:hypothetical protein
MAIGARVDNIFARVDTEWYKTTASYTSEIEKNIYQTAQVLCSQ